MICCLLSSQKCCMTRKGDWSSDLQTALDQIHSTRQETELKSLRQNIGTTSAAATFDHQHQETQMEYFL